jgi:hypothetical protein
MTATDVGLLLFRSTIWAPTNLRLRAPISQGRLRIGDYDDAAPLYVFERSRPNADKGHIMFMERLVKSGCNVCFLYDALFEGRGLKLRERVFFAVIFYQWGLIIFTI